jgi:transcription initiation factor IIF auxiliary subunit
MLKESVIIIIENTSERVAAAASDDDDTKDNTSHWFLWTVSVKSIPTTFLNYIESVIYYLHPTFSQNIIKSKDKESNFLLVSQGWGEFNITIEIVLKDQRRAILNHWLSLKDENGINKNQTIIKIYDDDFKKPRINLTR